MKVECRLVIQQFFLWSGLVVGCFDQEILAMQRDNSRATSEALYAYSEKKKQSEEPILRNISVEKYPESNLTSPRGSESSNTSLMNFSSSSHDGSKNGEEEVFYKDLFVKENTFLCTQSCNCRGDALVLGAEGTGHHRAKSDSGIDSSCKWRLQVPQAMPMSVSLITYPSVLEEDMYISSGLRYAPGDRDTGNENCCCDNIDCCALTTITTLIGSILWLRACLNPEQK